MPNNSSSEAAETQRHLDRELKDMISELTSHMSHLRQAHGQNQAGDEEDNGVRIITLAGTNTGATLKSELGADPTRRQHHHHGAKLVPPGDDDDDDDDEEEETEEMGTLVNSNFQAVNNSIMLGGSFSSNDPGVKVEQYISDDDDHPRHQRHHRRRHGHRNTKGKGRNQPIAGSSN